MRGGIFPPGLGSVVICCALVVLSGRPAAGQPAPALDVGPLHLSFTIPDSSTEVRAQAVQIRNTGGGELVWQARADAAWLLLAPSRGLAPGTLMVAVDARALGPGTHSAQVTIEAAHAAGSPQSVGVDVAVANTEPPGPPALTVSPDRLAGSAHAGQARGIVLRLRVEAERNAGIAWTAQGDAPWLTVSPSRGTTPAVLTVTASASPLPVGEHTANVVVRPVGRGAPLRVPVLLSVDAGPEGSVLAFDDTTLPSAALNTAYAQALPVRGGRPPYTFQVGGSLPPGLALVSGVISGVARVPGHFEFTVTVTDSADPPSTVTQTLDLDVATEAKPALHVEPSRVSFDARAGGATAPVAVSLSAGGGVLRWTAAGNAPWLRIRPAAGTSPATFEVTVDARRLPRGSYSAAIVVTMEGAAGSPREIAVEVTIR